MIVISGPRKNWRPGQVRTRSSWSVDITQNGSGTKYDFICYSTDGSTPDCTCTAAGLTKDPGNSVANVTVTANTTINAIGCLNSGNMLPASGSATYQSASVMAQPSITPAAAAQSDWVDVTFTNNDPTRTARICYTTDGSTPTPTATCGGTGATKCTTNVTSGNSKTVVELVKATNVTVNARACDIANPPVKSISSTASITYTLKVAAPTLTTLSPPPGSVPIGSSIAWESATTKASPVQFYYTNDGSTPDCLGGGNGTLGTSYTMIDPSKTTIKVIACSPQMTPSDVSTFTYSYFIETPTFSPGSGTYNDNPLVTFNNAPSDNVVPTYTNFFCVRQDGGDPTCNAGSCGFGSTQVAPGGYYVIQSVTLKAIACSNSGLPASAVSSQTYNLEVGDLDWSPSPTGTYTSPQAVSVTVNPAPTEFLGGVALDYTVCTATGAVSIPPQPSSCAGLKGYLDGQTPGTSWTCTSKTDGSATPLGTFNVTTTVSAIACKNNMVWNTSQQTYSFNPYTHTINIDGANDFSGTNDALSTSGGDTAYFSWDATNLYFGYNGFSFGSGQTVSAYFGDGVSGTTTADDAGVGGALAKPALYHLVWVNTSATAKVRKWNSTTTMWEDDATVPVTVGYTGGTSTYVEFSITRASIGSPNIVHATGGILDAAGTGYDSVWPSTAWADTYVFELLGAATPATSAIN